jgi:hypothetical protein
MTIEIVKCADCPFENPTIADCIESFKSGAVGCNSDYIILDILSRLEALENP